MQGCSFFCYAVEVHSSEENPMMKLLERILHSEEGELLPQAAGARLLEDRSLRQTNPDDRSGRLTQMTMATARRKAKKKKKKKKKKESKEKEKEKEKAAEKNLKGSARYKPLPRHIGKAGYPQLKR